MTYSEAIAIVGGSMVAVVGIAVALTRLLRKNGNGNGKPAIICPLDIGSGMDRLIAAVEHQTQTLGEVRDRLVSLYHQADKHGDALVRIETSASAVHRRLDGITPTRQP